MSDLKECPRCGDRVFEVMSDYAHCPQCLYYEDYWLNAADRDRKNLDEAEDKLKEYDSTTRLFDEEVSENDKEEDEVA
jgi:hypothetical protein